jgi:hypothetical protein
METGMVGNKLTLNIICHAAAGFVLGVALSMAVIFVAPSEVAMLIARDANPRATAMIIASYLTLMMTVGATLTGFVFTTIEER